MGADSENLGDIYIKTLYYNVGYKTKKHLGSIFNKVVSCERIQQVEEIVKESNHTNVKYGVVD